MIASGLFGLVMAGALSVYLMCNRSWHSTAVRMQVARASSLALTRIIYGMEINRSLRGASVVMLNTNFHGWPFTCKYWETNGSPPSATSSIHHICNCGSYAKDGSWRLIISNTSDSAAYIEYNSQVRSLVFCPVTNLTGSNGRLATEAERKRVLICNYVSAARVTINANDTLAIAVTVSKRKGMFSAINTVSTTVKLRNSSRR
jgi:hypothetical protein